MNGYRRNIKNNFALYIDQWSDNHILGNIYGALKTGKNLNELRSYNFGIDNDGELELAKYDDFNTPTLYASNPNLITKLVYNFIPKDIRLIDSYEKELKAAIYINNVKKIIICIHILLWALLIYVVSCRFNLFYSIIIFISVFCFPGSSVIITNMYKTLVLIPLFPLYIFAFYYKYDNKLKNIIFYIGLSIIMFIQWSFTHWMSVIFQLPILLLSILLINIEYQIRDFISIGKTNILNLFFNHIKSYLIQYLIIIFYSLAITYIIVNMNYKEMIRLQPENNEKIYNLVWNRSFNDAAKISFVLLFDNNISDKKVGDSSSYEKYYPTYSLYNFIRHNLGVYKVYFNYPSIYPLWRLEQFLPKNFSNYMYKYHIEYISLNILLIIIFILNIIIYLKYKSLINLFVPFIFILLSLFWFISYSNIMPRVATHFHILPHLAIEYFSVIFSLYIGYLILLLMNINNIIKYKRM